MKMQTHKTDKSTTPYHSCKRVTHRIRFTFGFSLDFFSLSISRSFSRLSSFAHARQYDDVRRHSWMITMSTFIADLVQSKRKHINGFVPLCSAFHCIHDSQRFYLCGRGFRCWNPLIQLKQCKKSMKVSCSKKRERKKRGFPRGLDLNGREKKIGSLCSSGRDCLIASLHTKFENTFSKINHTNRNAFASNSSFSIQINNLLRMAHTHTDESHKANININIKASQAAFQLIWELNWMKHSTGTER